jgi:hypothetical protein
MQYFTVPEANTALGEVRPLVERMVAHRRAMQVAEAREEALQARIAGNGGLDPEESAAAAEAVAREAAEVAECIDAIQALGVQVKDVDSGLVDFPSLREGEEVLLCWLLGEDEIRFWHTLEGGFAGRRPL